MNQKSLLSSSIIKQLRMCGHFLYFKTECQVGRKQILIILEEYHELLQKELQDILQVQSGSLSEMIIKMEADGLIEKSKSTEDSRRIILRLTDKGINEAASVKEEYEKQVEELTSCLTEHQKRELYDLLSIILNHWKTI